MIGSGMSEKYGSHVMVIGAALIPLTGYSSIEILGV